MEGVEATQATKLVGGRGQKDWVPGGGLAQRGSGRAPETVSAMWAAQSTWPQVPSSATRQPDAGPLVYRPLGAGQALKFSDLLERCQESAAHRLNSGMMIGQQTSSPIFLKIKIRPLLSPSPPKKSRLDGATRRTKRAVRAVRAPLCWGCGAEPRHVGRGSAWPPDTSCCSRERAVGTRPLGPDDPDPRSQLTPSPSPQSKPFAPGPRRPPLRPFPVHATPSRQLAPRSTPPTPGYAARAQPTPPRPGSPVPSHAARALSPPPANYNSQNTPPPPPGFRCCAVSGADRNPESGSDPALHIPKAGKAWGPAPAGHPRARRPRPARVRFARAPARPLPRPRPAAAAAAAPVQPPCRLFFVTFAGCGHRGRSESKPGWISRSRSGIALRVARRPPRRRGAPGPPPSAHRPCQRGATGLALPWARRGGLLRPRPASPPPVPGSPTAPS